MSEIVIGGEHFQELYAHLFPGDADEHAAVALAGFDQDGRRSRLLVRELHTVPPEHFLPGTYGYRRTSPRFVAELSVRAAELGLAYVALHSHPGSAIRTSLSRDDKAAHRRLFPHLLDLTSRPVAGVALGTASAAGEVWQSCDRVSDLEALRVIGPRLELLTPREDSIAQTAARFDRQARLFGAAGQQILRQMHVAVVGAGGGGSMIIEQLAHLGVGELTIIDFDVVKEINLSRIVGSRPYDVGRKKVAVLKRLVEEIDPGIDCRAIDGDIGDLDAARYLLDADFLFLASDTITSRLVFNAIVHRYLIPGVQVGAKVDLARDREISQVYVAVRPVAPDHGCLQCNSLIDAMQLQREARTEEEERAQNYLDEPDVVDPSVVSLNGTAASAAVNVLLLSATGLSESGLWDHRLHLVRSGEVLPVRDKKLKDCPFCSTAETSTYALGGDPSSLPCRRGGTAEIVGAAPGQPRSRSWWKRLWAGSRR